MMSMEWLSVGWKRHAFEYPSLRLKPRTFRAVKLLAPSRSSFPPFRETLNIEIIETDVDNAAGEYDTLSYCWGCGLADREVCVVTPGHDGDGDSGLRALYISVSLESALLSLAREGNLESRRPIFADQISINQKDNLEKARQVALMGDIYSRGARTIVWLGGKTTESSRYFDFVAELSGEGIMSRIMGPNAAHFMNVFDAVMDSSIELTTEAEKEDRKDLLDLVARFGPRFPVRGLTEILNQPWLNRVWTVQEGCLPTVVSFRCGEKSLCFDCFRGGMLFYSVWTTSWNRMPKGPVLQDEFRARDRIYTLKKPFLRLRQERRAIHESRARRRSLYDAVVTYNVNDYGPKIGATKAEDRIYALLGLAEPDGISRETVEQMEVDNVRRTYTGFAASVLKRNMDVLLFSQMPKSPAHGHRLPSWVPDWSAEQLRTPYGYSDMTTPVFSAGGRGTGGDVVADISTGTLNINAIPLGRVLRVGVYSIQPDENATIQNIEFKSVRRFFVELAEFIDVAASINTADAPGVMDEEHRVESMIRLSDGGLSARQFPKTFDPTTAQKILYEIHNDISHWGQTLINVEAQSRSLSTFAGMIRSVGVMPWYWTPASEIDVIRLCAVDPIAAGRSWIRGLSLAISDVIRTLWSIGRLRLHLTMMKIGRGRSKRDLHRPVDKAVLERVGLKRYLTCSKEWEHYTSNLFKAIGRICFLTDTGYVGLGPCHMRVDDTVVVIPGSSVPHILRPYTASESPYFGNCHWDTSPWSYVGEAYCDGIMDGELLAARERGSARKFVIT
ncbi:heterokaryon incompatibility protein-domain-containing protein [Xylaria intraflava]|nr:heterokaryon incompatibility protein-domain-containing protein [Xylaria intraflava]